MSLKLYLEIRLNIAGCVSANRFFHICFTTRKCPVMIEVSWKLIQIMDNTEEVSIFAGCLEKKMLKNNLLKRMWQCIGACRKIHNLTATPVLKSQEWTWFFLHFFFVCRVPYDFRVGVLTPIKRPLYEPKDVIEGWNFHKMRYMSEEYWKWQSSKVEMILG